MNTGDDDWEELALKFKAEALQFKAERDAARDEVAAWCALLGLVLKKHPAAAATVRAAVENGANRRP